MSQPLNYLGPTGDSYRPPAVAIRLFVPFLLAAAAHTAFYTAGLTKLELIYHDLKVEFPVVTKLHLGLTRGFTSGNFSWLWLLPALLIPPVILGLLVRTNARTPDEYRRRRRVAMWVACGLAALLVASTATAWGVAVMTVVNVLTGL